MTFNMLLQSILQVLPDAVLFEDDDGEICIATGLAFAQQSGRVAMERHSPINTAWPLVTDEELCLLADKTGTNVDLIKRRTQKNG